MNVSREIKRIDAMLHDGVLKKAEGEGNDFLATLIKGMDPKRLSPADRSSLNDVLGYGESGVMIERGSKVLPAP